MRLRLVIVCLISGLGAACLQGAGAGTGAGIAGGEGAGAGAGAVAWAGAGAAPIPSAPMANAAAVQQSAPKPPIPQVRSPVELFRELLEMSPAELNQYLTNRPPEKRELIRAKLREYKALSPRQRELRLQSTELRYYMVPLMQTPIAKRADQLAAIPERTRKLIEDRLKAWDMLPPPVQRELLANEATLRFFSESEGATELDRERAMQSISPERRRALEAGVAQWLSVPEPQRQAVLGRFAQFFDLTGKEKEAALKTLSDPERRQIEKTLAEYGHLSPSARAECIRALARYADLGPEERQQFLHNAERWKQMPLEQRKEWRDLVARLSSLPPLPPSAARAFYPPLPPGPSKPLLTNGN